MSFRRLSLCPILFSVAALLLLARPAAAQSPKAEYLAYVKEAAEHEWRRYPQVIAEWRRNVNPSVLWGYDAPGQPIYLADVFGFLYEETGDVEYARRAARLLSEFGDLRSAYPADYRNARAEYVNGIPALANFFFLPPYSRSYMRIRDSGALDGPTREKIETALAHSLDFVFHFPEWGAHNRAMLRAEGLYYGYLAMPDHPNSGRWKQMAETIASDNLRQWEIEDATIYHSVWLTALFSYAEISGNEWIYDQPFLRYYHEYFKRLHTPADNVPDVGDATWNPTWEFYLAAYEKLAARYQDPEMKWVASRLRDKMFSLYPEKSAWSASNLARAYAWADDSIQPRKPTSLSQEVVDDIVGKKVVFRNGWEPTSTYLLLNYRDEGDGGFNHREFLRNTISVEEEKMTHGNSDENDLSLLMADGSVLLHDAGYRDGLPSGLYGAYRADYFHNRLVARRDKRDFRQSLQEFVRNSGAYRTVRTQKIDFLTLRDVDMSRTRLTDDRLGYRWDRIVTYVKPLEIFLVVDAVEVLETDYFTFTNFFHTRRIHERGDHYYDTSIDSIATFAMPQNKRLLVRFLDNEAKQDSFYAQNRHYTTEQSIYQTKSSHYRAGDFEVFVTALVPHDPGAPVAPLLDDLRLLPSSRYPEAVAVEIDRGGERSILGIKLDLESEVVRENIRPRYTWEAGRTQYGDFETDAHFFFGTVSADSVRYSASEVLKVLYRGRPLMEALPNTHGLQLDGGPDRVGYVKWRYWEDALPAR